MEQLLKKGRKVPAATRSADMASFLECWDLLGEFADALPVEARRAGDAWADAHVAEAQLQQQKRFRRALGALQQGALTLA